MKRLPCCVVLLRDGTRNTHHVMCKEKVRCVMHNPMEHQWLSAAEARRAADRAVFGDLVGCALSSGDPLWLPTPEPHWRIPYRSFDGTVLIVVDVDARTGAVALTDEERAALMDKIEGSPSRRFGPLWDVEKA